MAEDLIVGGVGEIVSRLIALAVDEIGLVLGVKNEVRKLQSVLINIKERFNLEPASSSSNPVPNHRQTTSFVDVSTVVGRESDKDKIVAMLLSRDSASSSNGQEVTSTSNGFQIVPIIGFGGIGKTTLAQQAYNDDAVKDCFDLRLWICVSHDFDTISFFAQILEQIPGDVNRELSSKQVLQNNLESALKEKKFWIVLDDVWNEKQEQWEDFVLPLKNFGDTGSKVMVTSRSLKVASIVRAQNPCELKGLSDDSCTLIETHAFLAGGPDKTPNLLEIGKEISKKCKGVPLIAKFLGGLLYSKKGEREWLAVQNIDFWNSSFDEEENYVMEVLKIKFQKSIIKIEVVFFILCDISKGSLNFERVIDIQLWMAQGFFETSSAQEESTMEDIGNT